MASNTLKRIVYWRDLKIYTKNVAQKTNSAIDMCKKNGGKKKCISRTCTNSKKYLDAAPAQHMHLHMHCTCTWHACALAHAHAHAQQYNIQQRCTGKIVAKGNMPPRIQVPAQLTIPGGGPPVQYTKHLHALTIVGVMSAQCENITRNNKREWDLEISRIVERDLQLLGLLRVIERIWVATSRETTNVISSSPGSQESSNVYAGQHLERRRTWSPWTPLLRASATIDERKVYYKTKNMRERNSVTYKSPVKILLTKTWP